MGPVVFFLYTLILCTTAQSAPWSQCCTLEEKTLRCSADLNRFKDCSSVVLPGRQYDTVLISEKVIRLILNKDTSINLLVVSTKIQFQTTCDEKISEIKFGNQIKKCRKYAIFEHVCLREWINKICRVCVCVCIKIL